MQDIYPTNSASLLGILALGVYQGPDFQKMLGKILSLA